MVEDGGTMDKFKDKVFCKRCKHYIPYWHTLFGRSISNVMECRLEQFWSTDWDEVSKGFAVSPRDKNRYNNCLNYEPKWWRK